MIKNLELELTTSGRAVTTLKDYYCRLEQVTKNQEAAESIEEEIVRPQVDDEKEFDAIWQFHEEMLIVDPAALFLWQRCMMPLCSSAKKPRIHPVDISAFNFIFARMENPQPLLDKGAWHGYRLKKI